MRTRLTVMVAGAVVLSLSSLGHAAPKPTIDGKKVTKFTWEATPTAQQHAQEHLVESFDPKDCTPDICNIQQFRFKPAAGKTGTLSVGIKWVTAHQTDLDLFVVTSEGSTIAQCGGALGNGEIVSIPLTKLESGHTYSVVTHYYNVAAGEKLTGTISFPSDYTPSDFPLINYATLECASDGSD